MKLSLAVICSLFLTESLAISFPNDMFYHHHPDVAEDHAKKLYQVNNRYSRPQGYRQPSGYRPPRNAYNREPPRQRYPYHANYNGNGISKRGIKYTEDGAIDWSSMAGSGKSNNRNFYTDQKASSDNYRGAYNEMPYEPDYREQGPRQLYDYDGYEPGPRQFYGYEPRPRQFYGYDDYEPRQPYGNDGYGPRQFYGNDGYEQGPQQPYRDDGSTYQGNYDGNKNQGNYDGNNNQGNYDGNNNQGNDYANNNQGNDYANNNQGNDYGGDSGYNSYDRTSDSQYNSDPNGYQDNAGQQDGYQNPPGNAPEVSGNDVKNAAVDTDYTRGQGTFYDLETHVGACGKQRKNSEFIAALNSKQMGSASSNNPNCGKSVEVIGPNGKSVKVEIVDDCKTCKSGDLDLSPAAFEQLGDFSHGSIPIKWKFA